MPGDYPMEGEPGSSRSAPEPAPTGSADLPRGIGGRARGLPAFLLRHRRQVAWYAGWVAVALGLILILSNFSGDARAQPPVNIQVDATPVTVAVGQSATLTVTISGGYVLSPVGGSFHGYQVWWFYGSTNASGSIGYVYQRVPAPSGCTYSAPCATPVTLTVSHVYETPGSYDTSFTVYDAQGNYRISTDVVTVVPAALVVSARSTVGQAQVDQPVGFEATSVVTPAPYANDQITYQWLFGDNNSSYGDPVSHAFTQAGNYVVRVVATDNRTGAANQTFLVVTVTDPAPQAVITGATTGVEDSPVYFSGFASVAPYSDHPFLRYRWNFGNGERGAGANTSTVYTQAGTYQVELTVTNPLGESSVATRVVSISDPLPRANAGPTLTVPVGQMAFLNASNSTDVPTDAPFLNYTWQTLNYAEPGSNGVIGRQDYFSPGTMDVGLTVRSDTDQTVEAGTQVNVLDVAPTVGVYEIYQKVNVSLIVNSEYAPYYQLHLLEWNRTVATGRLFDFPPFATFLIPFAQINISVPYEFQVIYTGPAQPESIANPAMLEVQYDHGGIVRVPVIFTTQESEIWGASANGLGLGQPLFLTAAAFSPAQTGLTTTWSFGDGTSATQTTSAPGIPEPTYQTLSLVHTWAAGRDYTLTVTTRDAYGLTGEDTIQIQEVGFLDTSDLAPSVTFPVEPVTTEQLPTSLSAEITDSNIFYSHLSTRWVFGDGDMATTEGGSSGVQAATNLSTVSHVYTYGRATYAVVVYASSPGGSTTANWFFLPVLDPAPVPVFTLTPGTGYEGSPVDFNATASTVAGSVHQGLVYGWDFGDGPAAVGNWGAGATLTYVYTREGVFPVTLTVTNPEGTSSSVVDYESVIDAPLAASLRDRTVVVDQTVGFHPFALGTFPPDVATLRGEWSWGDGSFSSGLNVTHMYGRPGSYYVLLTLTDEDGNSLSVGATVQVVDSVPTVSLPYGGYTTYGENHTAYFRATTLGSLADELYGGDAFQYQWTFGDGTPGLTGTGGVTDTVGHVYTVEGNPRLQVNVTTPFGTTGSANVTLISVPDSDGDGIPNLYAQAVMHISPYNPDASGSGLTNFVKYFVLGGNATNADTLGAGLTDFQQVFGTVTGYVTNPMDPNEAGLALKNGQFLFGDTFTSGQVASLPATVAIDNPSNPVYGGNAISFNESELIVEVLSPDLSQVSLTLQYGTEAGGTFSTVGTIGLPTPTNPVSTYYLLNNSPLTGPQSAYGLTVADFSGVYAWQLSASGSGTLHTAEIVDRYYTDPALADPTASGMIVGPTITTPLYNFSEPLDSNFTEFDPSSFSYSTVDYYPYTETYYKLSAIQGIPYYPSYNQSTGQPQATYYGDEDFGIAPWNAHAAGDNALTNGMKALGSAVYDKTANKFVPPSGGSQPSLLQRYAYDGLSYTGPMNPTAYSTSDSGVADSQAALPTAYLVGAFSLDKVVDYGCSKAISDSNAANVQIQVDSVPGAPSIYTPIVSGYGSSHPPLCTTPWQEDTTFAFNDYYTIPINQLNTYPALDPHLHVYFQNEINPQLWYKGRNDGGASDTSFELWWNNSFAVNNGQVSQTVWSPNQSLSINGGDWTFGLTVTSLSRTNAVLVSQANESTNIPGYGVRYHGEGRFYVFNLYVPQGATGPFVDGENTVIESRTSFLSSSLNSTISSGHVPSCLNSSGVTVSIRSSNSQSLVAGGFNGTVDDACATTLLNELLPRNASGVVDGQAYGLDTVAFDLSGLPNQLDPYLPLAGYQSPMTSGPAPDATQEIIHFIQEAFDFFAGIFLAVVNFFVQLAEAIGQAILGALNAVINAVVSAIDAVISALEWLLNYVANLAKEAINAIKNFFVDVYHEISNLVIYPFLSLLLDENAMSRSAYDKAMNSTVGNDKAPLTKSNAINDIFNEVYAVIAIISAIFVTIGIVQWILAIVTAGAYEGAEQATEDSVTASVTAAVSGILAVGSTGLGVLSEASTSVENIISGSTGDVNSSLVSFLEGFGMSTNNASQAGGLLSGLLLPFLKLVTQEFESFDFIVGGALELVAVVLTVLSFTLTTPLEQVVVTGLAVIFSVVSFIVTIAGPSDLTNDVANTQLAQDGLIAGGLATIGVSLGSLITAAQQLA